METNDMNTAGRLRFSEQDDWQLVDDDQDIRGWEVRSEAGGALGRVDDLLLNASAERVEALLLEDGTTVEIGQVRIGDDAVYVRDGAAGSHSAGNVGATAAGAGAAGLAGADAGDNQVTVYDDYGRVVRREQVGEGSGGDAFTGTTGTGSTGLSGSGTTGTGSMGTGSAGSTGGSAL